MADFIALVILLIGVLLIFYLLNQGKHKISSRRPKGLFISDKEKIKEKWQEVEKLLKLKGGSRLKTAIVEADKLLMVVLELMGFSGTPKEKLLAAKSLFSDFQGVFSAHLLRNRVVHELDFEPSYYETKEAISKFQQALKDLGVL